MLESMKSMDGEGKKDEFSWQRSYRDAMLELRPAELGAKVRLAVSELELRSSELLLSHEGELIREWQAIADAMSNLRVIERCELKAALEGKSQGSRGENAAKGAL